MEHQSIRYLPLFTSIENATLYANREIGSLIMAELPTARHVIDALTTESGQLASYVLIDPIDNMIGEYIGFNRESLASELGKLT